MTPAPMQPLLFAPHHGTLCAQAAEWLRARRGCDPVLTKVGSAGEIPDAIGWSSRLGSTVVECKTSRGDFLTDHKKYIRYRHLTHKWFSVRRPRNFEAGEFVKETAPAMGDFRFFLCPPEVADAEDIKERHPDHGLLHIVRRRIVTVVDAPKREIVAHRSEVRYLRFALIHVRNNLLKLGCSVDLTELTKFFGQGGVELPKNVLP